MFSRSLIPSRKLTAFGKQQMPQQRRWFKKLASPGALPIDSLIVTQIGLRTPPDEMKRMAMYIASGGRFIQPPLVCVARFIEEPQKLYVYDGHHRMIAILLAGRKILLDDEFEFVEGSYAKCRKIDWDEKFVTPFDPRTECRLPNFREFKASALEIFDTGDIHAATEYVIKNHSMYMRPRGRIISTTDLASELGLEPLTDSEIRMARKNPKKYHHPFGIPQIVPTRDGLITAP